MRKCWCHDPRAVDSDYDYTDGAGLFDIRSGLGETNECTGRSTMRCAPGLPPPGNQNPGGSVGGGGSGPSSPSTSGVICVEYGVNYADGPILQRLNNVATADECQQKCFDNTECRYWSWKDGRNGPKCRLMASLEFTKKKNKNSVSGSVLGDCQTLRVLTNCQCETFEEEEAEFKETVDDYEYTDGAGIFDIRSGLGDTCRGKKVRRCYKNGDNLPGSDFIPDTSHIMK